MAQPYGLPHELPADLARVQAYWRSLLRGEAQMPFWDDMALTALPDLTDRLFLIDVFERPERFRFNTIGSTLDHVGLAGEFLDEMKLSWPLNFLRSQCSATVEAAAPTYLRYEADHHLHTHPDYARLLLPMWGEGHVGMLLGVVEFQ